MDPSADFKRTQSRRRRNPIARWVNALLVGSTIGHTLAQSVSNSAPVSNVCVELQQTVMTQIANGKLKESELAVSAFLDADGDYAQTACAGIVLNDMAVFMSVSGRLADAERLAERSVLILEKTYAPNDQALLRPLQTLAAARFEQGKTARARETLQKMQAIPTQRPEDRARVHATAAPFLAVEGRLPEAEAEYLAAIRAWEDAGHSRTADMGVLLNDLGSLYINEQRFTEARRALDRAFSIFSHAKDAAPMDRIKLLNVRGVLQARQGNWHGAEQDLHDALSIADREPWVDPVALRSLLANYAIVLRRNHQGREARSIEARAAAIRTERTGGAIVDISDLVPKAKPPKR